MYRILPLVLVFCAPLASGAEGMDYTYLEGGYVNTEIDVGSSNVDGDGVGIRGSLALSDNINLLAGYAFQDFDFGVDVDQWQAGLGFHTPITQELDFVASLSYVNVSADSGFAELDDDGYAIGGGVRFRANEQFELEGGLDYVDVGDSDTSLRGAGRYYFNDEIAVGLGVSFGDDVTTWELGLRWELGNRL